MLVVKASGAKERCVGRAKFRRDRTRRGVREAGICLRSGCRWVGDLAILKKVISFCWTGKRGKTGNRRDLPRPND